MRQNRHRRRARGGRANRYNGFIGGGFLEKPYGKFGFSFPGKDPASATRPRRIHVSSRPGLQGLRYAYGRIPWAGSEDPRPILIRLWRVFTPLENEPASDEWREKTICGWNLFLFVDTAGNSFDVSSLGELVQRIAQLPGFEPGLVLQLSDAGAFTAPFDSIVYRV